MLLDLDENTDAWRGSYYELVIEMDAHNATPSIQMAVDLLIQSPDFRGLWEDRSQILQEAPFTILQPETSILLGYGVLDVQPGIQLGTVIHSLDIQNEAKNLSVCIHTGMLNEAYDVNYPLHETLNPWRRVVDDKLLSIADYIYQHLKFEMALISEEIPDAYELLPHLNSDSDFGIVLLPSDSPLIHHKHRCHSIQRESSLIQLFGKYIED